MNFLITLYNNEKDESGKSSMRRLYDCLEVYPCIKANLVNVDVYGGRPLGFMYCIFFISCKISCGISDAQLFIYDGKFSSIPILDNLQKYPCLNHSVSGIGEPL